MNWFVEWLPMAYKELSEVWLASRDRPAVSKAAYSLDQQLAVDPESIGESRPDGNRIHFAAPLGILFRVDAEDRKVVVVNVWSFRQRRT